MYAVGVGNAVEDELKEIASEPTGEHYFYTADFKAMTQIAKKLQINICQGADVLTLVNNSQLHTRPTLKTCSCVFCSVRGGPLRM